MIDKVQFHKDMLHLLTDLAQSLDDADMDTLQLQSIYSRVIAEHIQDLQEVVDQEGKPAAYVDPLQMTIWDLKAIPGQGSVGGQS